MLIHVPKVGHAHGKPLMGSEDGKGAVMVDPADPSITDEGVGQREVPAGH